MESVSVSELQRNPRAVLQRVKAGELIEVTVRGIPVARFEPVELAAVGAAAESDER